VHRPFVSRPQWAAGLRSDGQMPGWYNRTRHRHRGCRGEVRGRGAQTARRQKKCICLTSLRPGAEGTRGRAAAVLRAPRRGGLSAGSLGEPPRRISCAAEGGSEVGNSGRGAGRGSGAGDAPWERPRSGRALSPRCATLARGPAGSGALREPRAVATIGAPAPHGEGQGHAQAPGDGKPRSEAACLFPGPDFSGGVGIHGRPNWFERSAAVGAAGKREGLRPLWTPLDR
jgi:hypothetical protein